MKVLITGGAGYVGSVLVPKLLEAGHEVRVLDNLMHGGHALLGLFAYPNFEFMRGDIRDRRAVMEALRGADMIIHLAAIVGYPGCKKDPRLELRPALPVLTGSRKIFRQPLGQSGVWKEEAHGDLHRLSETGGDPPLARVRRGGRSDHQP